MGLNKQLGYYVGEYIVDHYLPTLNTDLLKTRNIINVSDEEFKEYEKLEDNWKRKLKIYDGDGDSNKEFEESKKYRNILANKYLPKILKCNVPKVAPTDIEQFKKGIVSALWNSDLSWYSCKTENIEIKIYNDDYVWCSEIRLKLEINE
jgi:hypothetical protein